MNEGLQEKKRHFLEALVGHWEVAMTTTPEQGEPIHATGLFASKSWFGDGRYVREDIQGVFEGTKHEKLTLLGFNATRNRYEYVTADNHDGVILLYVTCPGDRSTWPTLTLFAEYAMPSEQPGMAASFVTVRTTLTIEGHDRHVLRNSYHPAGQEERPFLEYVYTRTKQLE